MDTEDQESQAGAEDEKDGKNTASGEVHTGGGVYAAGDVATEGGDFMGRDKAGRDIYNFSGPVVFNQSPEGKAPPIPDKLPGSNVGQDTPLNPAILPADADKPIDIFLSYSRIDAEMMRRLRDDLRAAGFTVWTDDVGLEPGTPSWQHAIEEAIQAARCVVTLLSPEAKQSKWVEIEVSIAEDIGLRVIPVLVRGDTRNAVLFRLQTTQWIDMRDDYQKALREQLIPALWRYLRGTKTQEKITQAKNQIPAVIKRERVKTMPGWMRMALGIGFGVALLIVLVVSNWSHWRDFFSANSLAIPPFTTLATSSIPTQLALIANTVTPTVRATAIQLPTPSTQQATVATLTVAKPATASFTNSPVRLEPPVAPTNTPIPPSPTPSVAATPIPPTHSLARISSPTPCQVDGPFSSIWSAHQKNLGYAPSKVQTGPITIEAFEGGYLIWIKAEKRIYAIENNGDWSRHDDTWELGTDTPCKATLLHDYPVMGFRQLWCSNKVTWLKEPREGETPYPYAQRQLFAHGQIIQVYGHKIFVLFDDYKGRIIE